MHRRRRPELVTASYQMPQFHIEQDITAIGADTGAITAGAAGISSPPA
jgi:hypothetical protein